MYTAVIAIFAFYGLGLSGSAWSYYSLLKGIHESGEQPLRFRPFYDDKFLGLRPLGSLALSLVLAYFGAIALFIAILIFATSPSIGIIIGVCSMLGALIVLGLVMFFLPLRKLHARMLEEKAREEESLAERFTGVLSLDLSGIGTDQSKILDMLRLDLMDRKISSLRSWPFDMDVLSKLSLVIISVTAAPRHLND